MCPYAFHCSIVQPSGNPVSGRGGEPGGECFKLGSEEDRAALISSCETVPDNTSPDNEVSNAEFLLSEIFPDDNADPTGINSSSELIEVDFLILNPTKPKDIKIKINIIGMIHDGRPASCIISESPPFPVSLAILTLSNNEESVIDIDSEEEFANNINCLSPLEDLLTGVAPANRLTSPPGAI